MIEIEISKVAEKSFETAESHYRQQKVDSQEFTADATIFVDGSIESFDEIVDCPGYAFFSFLS